MLDVANEPLVTPAGKPGRAMSFEEFLDAIFDHDHYEWVDGEAMEMPAVNDAHNQMTVWLITVLQIFVRRLKLGKIRHEPYEMQCVPGGNGRAPDVFFVATANLFRLEKKVCAGPADLAVEVVSPSNSKTDYKDKFGEYERGGVREYWLIDPLRRRVHFYRLGADGAYAEAAPGADGIYHSLAISGLWIRVDWLWNRPDELDVLAEWGLIGKSNP